MFAMRLLAIAPNFFQSGTLCSHSHTRDVHSDHLIDRIAGTKLFLIENRGICQKLLPNWNRI